jgi:GH25 family lysozyme M1 (1,4-beta-N-acetylmuramidase)
MRTKGVDISKWQGDEIDWGRVGSTDISFVIMKATQGTRIDPEFLKNWRDCAKKCPHIVRGAYHLVELDDPIEQQVAAFLAAVPGDGWPKGVLPPFLDVETSKIDEIPDNPEVDRSRILEFCRRVEHAVGVSPVIYISPRGVRHLKGHVDGLGKYHLWHVEYLKGEPKEPKLPEQWNDWLFWQYTSSGDDPDTRPVETGKSFGFESNGLDLDLFNGSLSDLRTMACFSGSPVAHDVDVASALSYNAGRGYPWKVESEILRVVGSSPWDSSLFIRNIAKWQAEHGLHPDGMVGPATLEAMSLKVK